MTYKIKMASHTPLPPATARVSHGVRKARSATIAAVNIDIGAASGARQRSGTRNMRSAMIDAAANIQCRKSTGSCVVAMLPSPLYVLFDFDQDAEAQQSTQTTASPPLEVSLYLSDMSLPVRYKTFTTWSKVGFIGSSPLNMVRRTAFTALFAASALRLMHGTWTRPATGSQVNPRLCSSAIAPALSTWATLPPSTSQRPVAAIRLAAPTSPWQPTSAPAN